MTSAAALDAPRRHVEFSWLHDDQRRAGSVLSVSYIGQLGVIVTLLVTFPDEPHRPDYKVALAGRIVPGGVRLNVDSDLPERHALMGAATAALTFDDVVACAFRDLTFDAAIDDIDRDGVKLLVTVARHMPPGAARDVAVTLIQGGFAGTPRELIGAATAATAA